MTDFFHPKLRKVNVLQPKPVTHRAIFETPEPMKLDDAPIPMTAIETATMGMIAAREDITAPRAKGLDSVALPALICAKLELYNAMSESKVGKAALAKRLGVAPPQVARLQDLRHQSKLDALERELETLERSLTIVVKKLREDICLCQPGTTPVYPGAILREETL